jgi:hypothetical protein
MEDVSGTCKKGKPDFKRVAGQTFWAPAALNANATVVCSWQIAAGTLWMTSVTASNGELGAFGGDLQNGMFFRDLYQLPFTIRDQEVV